LSALHTKSSTGLVAIHHYYRATNIIAQKLATLFQVLMPECYDTYKTAFEAGKWLESDPGPWVGRAIVYKLQVDLHKDKEDGGPAASFPVGSFTGGEMLIPQLKAKLAYASLFFITFI
jgi:hypothetical protein